jgi:hypothetical protein
MGSTPYYNLEDVRRAVEGGNVKYAGRKVLHNVEDLKYTLNDVKKCVLSLTEQQFSKTHNYDGKMCDAYTACYSKDGERYDKIYIKLTMVDEKLKVIVCSFHL